MERRTYKIVEIQKWVGRELSNINDFVPAFDKKRKCIILLFQRNLCNVEFRLLIYTWIESHFIVENPIRNRNEIQLNETFFNYSPTIVHFQVCRSINQGDATHPAIKVSMNVDTTLQ